MYAGLHAPSEERAQLAEVEVYCGKVHAFAETAEVCLDCKRRARQYLIAQHHD